MKSFKLPFKMDSESLMPTVSYGVFGLSVLFMILRNQYSTILLAVGMSMLMFSITNDMAVSLLSGACIGLIPVVYASRIRKEGFEDTGDIEEGLEEKEKEEKPKKKKRAPPPDNADRKEMFELGKKYKAPKEEDDAEFHLDAGTTFMNAYKSLKPDQIAAMTKDTQDLMNTQKQLMSTLHTLKPLIKDGKDMMEMFQGYFGGGAPGGP